MQAVAVIGMTWRLHLDLGQVDACKGEMGVSELEFAVWGVPWLGMIA